jgi:hypothetical protein
MSIQLAFTKNGPIIGDFEPVGSGSYTVNKPAILQPQQAGISFFPLLGMCEESVLTLSPDDINYGQLFTPVADLRNVYSEKFGSGLQLVTNSVR